jgi:hypothetical protein
MDGSGPGAREWLSLAPPGNLPRRDASTARARLEIGHVVRLRHGWCNERRDERQRATRKKGKPRCEFWSRLFLLLSWVPPGPDLGAGHHRRAGLSLRPNLLTKQVISSHAARTADVVAPIDASRRSADDASPGPTNARRSRSPPQNSGITWRFRPKRCGTL